MKILLISLFLVSCAQAPIKEVCPQAQYSFTNLHTKLTTKHGFTYHRFNHREHKILVSLFNDAPPKSNINPDFVGFFLLADKKEVFIVMVVNDCVINYGNVAISDVNQVLNGKII
jgi:hypothetical protein